MKRIIFRLFLAAAAAVMLTSCFEDEEYLYSDVGMCTVLGRNKIQTDNGDIYHVVKNSFGADIPDTLKRVMISCDVMSAVEGRDNEYNIHLIQYAGAFSKAPVLASLMDEEVIGNDGVNVDQAWISGGYFNIHVQVAILNPTTVDHTIDLVYDDTKSTPERLCFEVRHNAKGECIENPEYNPNAFVVAGAYTSFPLTGILAEGSKPILHLEWEWYEGSEGAYGRDKVKNSGDIQLQ